MMVNSLQPQKPYMPAVISSAKIIDNLRLGRAETGVGGGSGGENFLKILNGKLVYGSDHTELAAGHRFVVCLQNFAHGYIDSDHTNKVRDRAVVPIAQQPARPQPPGGSSTMMPDGSTKLLNKGEYGTYEGGGPRPVTEITLNSIKTRGFSLVFTAWGISAANRIRNLLDLAITHADSEEGKAGFLHPVIEPKVGSYENRKWRKMIQHFDFDLIDWMHNDGQTLLSQATTSKLAGNTEDDDSDPWDSDDEEELTEEDRELLRA